MRVKVHHQKHQGKSQKWPWGGSFASLDRLWRQDRDNLSYTSLMNQIEKGQRKGYSDSEVIEAVIRAVSPGLPLRDLLEIKRNLTLPILKTILRGHYKVDSFSELLHRLMTLSQDPKESAQNFLFRVMRMKGKNWAQIWSRDDFYGH